MSKQISYQDMTIEVNIFSGKFDVKCRDFERKDLTAAQLAELVYPAIYAAAKQEAGK